MVTMKVGMIGLGQRGSTLLSSIMACEGIHIVAVSDLYEDRRERGQQIVVDAGESKPKAYADWHQLVDDPEVEAVVIAANWDTHIPMAIYAMNAHKPVASEVAGAYTLQDCWDLVLYLRKDQDPRHDDGKLLLRRIRTLDHLARAGGEAWPNRLLPWRLWP
jgi:predicted dehydrogenase